MMITLLHLIDFTFNNLKFVLHLHCSDQQGSPACCASKQWIICEAIGSIDSKRVSHHYF